MKKATLLFLFIILIISCEKHDNAYNYEKLRLLKISKFSNSSGSKLTDEVVYAYDKSGNMVKESFYDGNSTKILWMYKEYEYLDDKKVKEKIFDGEAGNPTLGLYNEYFYEGDLLVKEGTYCGGVCYGTLIHSMNYEYDERGNLTRKYMYDPDYGISGDLKYTYDNQNRLILEETTVVDVNDYDHKYLKHVYDNAGREIKLEYYNVNQNLIRYVVKVYKGTNKLTSMDLYYDKNGIQTAEYQHFYDKWENLTETINSKGCSYFKRKYFGKLLIEEINYWTWDTGFDDCTESGMSKYEYDELQ